MMNRKNAVASLAAVFLSATGFADLGPQPKWSWTKTIKGAEAVKISDVALKVVPAQGLTKNAEGDVVVTCHGEEPYVCFIEITGEYLATKASEPVVWKVELELSPEDSKAMYEVTLKDQATDESDPPSRNARGSAVLSCTQGKRQRVSKYSCSIQLESGGQESSEKAE